MVNGIPLNGYATDIAMEIQSSPTAVSNNSNLINLGNVDHLVQIFISFIICII